MSFDFLLSDFFGFQGEREQLLTGEHHEDKEKKTPAGRKRQRPLATPPSGYPTQQLTEPSYQSGAVHVACAARRRVLALAESQTTKGVKRANQRWAAVVGYYVSMIHPIRVTGLARSYR